MTRLAAEPNQTEMLSSAARSVDVASDSTFPPPAPELQFCPQLQPRSHRMRSAGPYPREGARRPQRNGPLLVRVKDCHSPARSYSGTRRNGVRSRVAAGGMQYKERLRGESGAALL